MSCGASWQACSQDRMLREMGEFLDRYHANSGHCCS